ncbi:MFS transporter [Brevibacillus daliensis]|uniref:MFS transporter n=1 Tax=Brevibacillus daliensis TaxID=2892995 RepID=UPI0035A01A49
MPPPPTDPIPTPRRGMALYLSLPIVSWALYDFANTIFSSNIITIFFPFYIQDIMGGNAYLDQIASSLVSYTNALASLFLVLLSPLFGVWIDRYQQKKRFLLIFAFMSILSTIMMGVAAYIPLPAAITQLPISVIAVILFFMLGKFFYQSGLIFYDAMLPDMGTKEEIPLLSGFGVAVGYLGTLCGLAVYPLAASYGYEAVFLASGLLFLLFSLPIAFLYKEPVKPKTALSQTGLWTGYKEIIITFKEMRTYRNIFLFMITYFFLNDAVATAIAMMSVYATTVLSFTAGTFIILYLVATLFSIVGSFVFGYITQRVGAKTAVIIVAIDLILAILLAAFAWNQTIFWLAGCLYGIVMGAMWVTSRTLIIQLTPPEKRGQFFGLFAFSGKVSAIVGPLLNGTITYNLADYGTVASRIAIGSLAILTFCGLYFHRKIKMDEESVLTE